MRNRLFSPQHWMLNMAFGVAALWLCHLKMSIVMKLPTGSKKVTYLRPKAGKGRETTVPQFPLWIIIAHEIRTFYQDLHKALPPPSSFLRNTVFLHKNPRRIRGLGVLPLASLFSLWSPAIPPQQWLIFQIFLRLTSCKFFFPVSTSLERATIKQSTEGDNGIEIHKEGKRCPGYTDYPY